MLELTSYKGTLEGMIVDMNSNSVKTKSIKQILFENFFTLFNFLNLFLAIAIFSVGSYKNMLFLLIVIINTAISTIQEIHSKMVVDKLSILATSKARVIRNGKKQEIPIDELVLNDIIEFHTGNQVATDCIVQSGEVLVDESFITGEQDSVTKTAEETILSGSYIVSGTCIAKVEHIGEENYISQISNGAKSIKKQKSEIMRSLNKIIKFLTFAIVPIGLALFYSQLHLQGATYQEAVVQTVAAIIGMIPEGLVLLTSTVLAVSVVRLSKSKVLVQDLYCIETLARIDTLALDKTGTLTEGTMDVKDCVVINKTNEDIYEILSNIALASDDENATMKALKKHFNHTQNQWIPTKKVAFSSKTKWSGIEFEEKGTYIIGAPEFVLKNHYSTYQEQIEKYSKDYRVMALAHSPQEFQDKDLPENIEFIGLVLLLDTIRKEAKSTIKYFYKQGVDVKVISGDNPLTVSKIAKRVGMKDFENYIDLSTLSENDNLEEIASKYTIFGRVSPIQKKELVKALQKSGKTVAMTGDGVNDVLALKESNCSIAMANGSDAAKNISQLVLLDSNFASMPKVVSEGRRTINNIQRSATLFLVKTIYSSLLAIMFLIMKEEYPFVPIQLSLISVVTIGIPSFMLALEPNKERIRGNFLKNVISKALPTGLTVVINIFALTILKKLSLIPENYFSSLCVISTGMCGLLLLFALAKSRKSEETKMPFSLYRLLLAICMLLLFIAGLTIFKDFFNIIPLYLLGNNVLRPFLSTLINFTVLNWLLKKVIK